MMLWLLLLLGIFLLLAGGTSLVRGATGIADAYGIPPLVVGLTVVAFGTSAPELVVNLLGAFQGETELAFGNIAGSNIANIALVLGSAALITPIAIEGQIVRREVPLLMLATAILLVLTLDPWLRGENSLLDRSDGFVLLLLFCVFVYMTAMDFMRVDTDMLITEMEAHPLTTNTSRSAEWGFIVAGLIGLTVGGQLTISNGSEIAADMGVSPAIIGLIVVAVGTSMPELVTSIIAAVRREADLCVGNVIGSNIFNSLMVLPLSSFVSPLSVPDYGSLDIFVSLALTLALVPIFIFGKAIMSRKVGALFLLIYITYVSARLAFA